MHPDYIITYGSLLKGYIHYYWNIVDSKQWERTDSKKNYKYGHLLMKDSTVAIEALVNKIVYRAYFKGRHNGK